MTETSAVNFNCPTKLLEDFDKTWKQTGRIPNRTDALLRAMENYIEKNQNKEAD